MTDAQRKTYGEICQEIADWLKRDTLDYKVVDLTADDIFKLDKHFPALAIHAFQMHMENGQDAVGVLVSDPYCAKLICKKMGWV